MVKVPTAFASNIGVIDSLKNELSKSTSSSERLILMNKLGGDLMDLDLKEAIGFSQKALQLARETNNKKAEAIALNNLGKQLYESPGTNNFLDYFFESECISDELGLRILQADNLMSIARYYRYVVKDSAITVNYFLRSAEICEDANYHYGAGRSYAKLASFYTRYMKIDLCEKYLKEAHKHYSKQPGDIGEETAHYYDEIGNKIWVNNPKAAMDFYFKGLEYYESASLLSSLANAHNLIGEPKIALSYLEKAIPKFRARENNIRMLGIALARFADVQIKFNNYEAAEKAVDEGIMLLDKVKKSYKKALPELNRLKGIIIEKQGDNNLALFYFNKGIEEANKHGFNLEGTKLNIELGRFYAKSDPRKAKQNCELALEKARKYNGVNMEIMACECLYNIYKAEGTHLSALKYHEQKVILSDSLNTLKISHALDINSKLAEKDKLIAEQSLLKEIKEQELKSQYKLNASLSTSIFLGILLIGFLTMGYFRIKKQNLIINEKTEELVGANQSLERSNNELERFAYITSHDLKTPIRSILNFSGLLRDEFDLEKNTSAHEYLNFIESSGNRMEQLIEDILEFSRLSGNITVKPEIIDLNILVNEITQLIQNSDNYKNSVFELEELPCLEWHYSQIFLLLKNIVENGIKYNKSEIPKVKISYSNSMGKHSIFIEDNGIGIDKKYFNNIFIMFNRLHTQQEFEGSGLGLATCKKIIDDLKGNISLYSEFGKGTRFQIDLPDHLIRNSSVEKTNASKTQSSPELEYKHLEQ